MEEIKEQIKLIKEIRNVRNKYREIKLSKLHYKYLLNFFKKHKFYILRLIFFIFVSGSIEALLIIFSRNRLSSNNYFLSSFFWQFFTIFIIFFIFSSFLAIKQEKTITILFTNKIRRRILKFFIERPVDCMTYDKQGDLIAKISYQLPLVSMGVSNVFFGFIRWFIYFSIIMLIAYLTDLNLLIVSILFLLLSIIIGIVAYIISKKYVSQEVTFFSQIMKHIDINLSERYFNKNFNNESFVLDKFDRLVNIDSFFRIRRDIWIKMSSIFVSAFVLFVVVFINFFSNEFFSWIRLLNGSSGFLYLFLLFYFPRMLNQALNVGLYIFPAKLGLFLTISNRKAPFFRKNLLKIENKISFSVKKTKIFKESKYFRNLDFVFNRGERILFYGNNFSGKTSIAKIFSGIKIYNSRAFKVKIDDKRFDYPVWQKLFSDLYFFDSNVRSQKSLIEFILGKNKEKISISDIEKTIEIISKNNFIASKMTSLKNFNSSCEPVLENIISSFFLQALYCISNKPSIIIIDNLWVDTNYYDIIEVLNVLDKSLPDSIIIIFSSKNNSYLNYKQKYELGEEIKKTL
ncbi:MAG: hypothetical protein PHZ07_03670 [Patescibacteria group bacterium]|nr:hypothetical protein [Patescibacteria group bacterium]MDD4304529.1 hypothetical protein [Patescibacteria group bacterium]MDD4695637.1 hypothetical protein [Patescibacteria group bacterium]